jgi:hypothetical protein
MGAGQKDEHYIQDAAELYMVLKLMKYLIYLNKSITKSFSSIENEFTKYCSERDIITKFSKSEYKINIDNHHEEFCIKLIEKYPTKKMDIKYVEVEYRNKSLKGDFIIEFDDSTNISVSLKNYKKGFSSIQLCSGTWNSLINNFVLKMAPGPGMYYDNVGKIFKGSNKSLRDSLYEELHPELIPYLHKLDDINNEIKTFYIQDENANLWDDIKVRWKDDCKKYGQEAAGIIKNCLDTLDKNIIKKRILEMTDLYNKEELLLLGGGKMMCSIFNDKYKDIVTSVNKEDTTLNILVKGQTMIFEICDSRNNKIINVSVPFTFNKNGAWYLPNEKYEGTKEILDKKHLVNLKWGERRPHKSKELATSTNTWFKISDYC